MIAVGIVAVLAGIRGYYSDSASDLILTDRNPVTPWQPPTDGRKPNRPPAVAKTPTFRATPDVRSDAPRAVSAVVGPIVPPLLPVAAEDVEEIGSPWYDDARCWGCSKGCKSRDFRPFGFNIGAEIRAACRGRALAEMEAPRATDLDSLRSRSHRQPGTVLSTDKASIWAHDCDTCGRAYRRALYGLASTVAAGVDRIMDDEEDEETAGVEDGLDVRLEGCPF